MRTFAAILTFVAGICLAIYVGVFVFFIGGIVNIIDGAKASPVDGELLAWGIAQVFLLATICGYGIFFIFSFIAGLLGFNRKSARHGRNIPGGHLSARQVENDWNNVMRRK